MWQEIVPNPKPPSPSLRTHTPSHSFTPNDSLKLATLQICSLNMRFLAVRRDFAQHISQSNVSYFQDTVKATRVQDWAWGYRKATHDCQRALEHSKQQIKKKTEVGFVLWALLERRGLWGKAVVLWCTVISLQLSLRKHGEGANINHMLRPWDEVLIESRVGWLSKISFPVTRLKRECMNLCYVEYEGHTTGLQVQGPLRFSERLQRKMLR